MVRLVMVNKLSIVILKGLLTTTFLVRVCAANKPLNFINWLFLRCTVPFSIKEVCVLSLIPSFIVLLLKGCLRLLQDLLYYLCGRSIDFQPLGFYGSLGHTSEFLHLFFFLIASIFDNFARNSRLFFWECPILLSTGLTSFPCAWFLFNDSCHLYAIYDIATEHLL